MVTAKRHCTRRRFLGAAVACTRRYAELCAGGHNEPNPGVRQALLNPAKEGKFHGRTVPCFFGSSERDYGIHRKVGDGEYAVYDLMPNAGDCFGIWENCQQSGDQSALVDVAVGK